MSDKKLDFYAYEVKVNYLIEEVQEIQKRMKAGDPVTA